jgi:3-hydroxyacyl-CoA dehydrogenase
MRGLCNMQHSVQEGDRQKKMSAQYFLRGGISFIKFSNPPVNGLSLGVREGIMRYIEQVCSTNLTKLALFHLVSSQARADKSEGLVLFGDGKNFSAGADITEFSKGLHLSAPGLNDVIGALDEYERPLVACMNGVALGGGLELALSCQWRFASPNAFVGLPEVHLGLLPGAGGTQRLPRVVGVEKAVEIMVSGRTVGAAEALKLNILDELAPRPFYSLDDLIIAGGDFILSDRFAVSSSPSGCLTCIYPHS